jgi:type IV secretory pathway VirB10-like protein
LAAREMNIRSAPILAISDGSVERLAQGLTGQAKGSPSISELEKQRADAQAGAQDQINRLMAAGSQTAQGTGGKGKLEADWLKEAAQVKKSHEPLRGYYPTSRFVLMQGGVINAVLMNALNTDLPGEVRARTTMDVYDSVGGNTLLIPKGSVLVGRYNSDVRVGQNRINTAFQRLILPNGLAVDLQGNIGQDQSGSAGLPGDVNNHYGQMFFVSVLTAIGAQIAARSEPANTGTTINTGSAGGTTNPAGQIFSDINRAVIERNRTTAATITIPAGTPFTINVANDVELPPYGRR